jgi:hypothetical protein
MCIRQPEHSYDCGRGRTKRSVELKGASAIAAAVVRKIAIQFARLVSFYHAIAGLSHCCVDQPTVLVVTAILSAIKLALSLRQQRNRRDRIRKRSSRSMRDDAGIAP